MSRDTDAIWKEITALRQLLQRAGKQEAAHVADYVPITATSTDGASDAVATVQPYPDQRRTPGQQTVQRVEPWGLRSRSIVNNLYGLVVRVLGGGSNPALVGLSAPGYGPGDLEAGETALYCMADGTLVKLTKVGKIEISAAGGQDVVVNGGTAKVARVGDDVNATAAQTAWETAVNAAIGVLKTATGAPVVDPPTPPTQIGDIATGADHFKA